MEIIVSNYVYLSVFGSAGAMYVDFNDSQMFLPDSSNFFELRPGEYGYPKKILEFLGKHAPEKLILYGDRSLLESKIVMVCGARDASNTGIDLAVTCGKLIAECGFTVLSGYARGVDLAAHRGALETGGKTIAALPYGLLRFRVHRDIQDVYNPDSFLVMSEFPVCQVFSTHTAFRRNKLMAAMADAVIVVEPGETGGTWYSAEKAGEMGKRLYFLEGGRPEIIPKLESLGGKRISLTEGIPDLKEVLEGL